MSLSHAGTTTNNPIHVVLTNIKVRRLGRHNIERPVNSYIETASSRTRHAAVSADSTQTRSSSKRSFEGLAHYRSRALTSAGPLIFGGAVCLLLLAAWINRDTGVLNAEEGIGYWLGIAGTAMMLLLVGYPLRKRFKIFSRLGKVAIWFRAHMVLGILGPALIILHSNFNLGSLNSRLALLTMSIVVMSGIVGRYLYAKVHRGLYGQHLLIRDVTSDIVALEIDLGRRLGDNAEIAHELNRFSQTIDHTSSLVREAATALATSFRTRSSRRRILRYANASFGSAVQQGRMTRRAARNAVKKIDAELLLFFAAVNQAQRLVIFDRLFGLWHHLHMPLFVLLALTVTIHIVAVHLY